MAARKACHRLIDGWLVNGDRDLPAEVGAKVAEACHEAQAHPDLKPEALQQRLQQSAAVPSLAELEATPGEALTRILATIEDQSHQSVATEDPGNWRRQAVGRVKEWIGGGGSELTPDNHDWRKAKFSRALAAAANKVAAEWSQQRCTRLFALMEHPGRGSPRGSSFAPARRVLPATGQRSQAPPRPASAQDPAGLGATGTHHPALRKR